MKTQEGILDMADNTGDFVPVVDRLSWACEICPRKCGLSHCDEFDGEPALCPFGEEDAVGCDVSIWAQSK